MQKIILIGLLQIFGVNQLQVKKNFNNKKLDSYFIVSEKLQKKNIIKLLLSSTVCTNFVVIIMRQEYGYNTKLFYQSKLPSIITCTIILGAHKKENSIRPKFMTKCLSISEILKCMQIMQLRIDKMQVTRIIRKKYKRTKILMEHYQKQIYVILIW